MLPSRIWAKAIIDAQVAWKVDQYAAPDALIDPAEELVRQDGSRVAVKDLLEELALAPVLELL